MIVALKSWPCPLFNSAVWMLVQPAQNRPLQSALLRTLRNFGAGPSHAGEPFVALVFPISPGAVVGNLLRSDILRFCNLASRQNIHAVERHEGHTMGGC